MILNNHFFQNMKLAVDPTTVIPSKFILEPASMSENLNFHEEDQEYRLLTAEENRRATADDHFQARKLFIFTLIAIYLQDTRLIRFSVDDKDSHFFRCHSNEKVFSSNFQLQPW